MKQSIAMIGMAMAIAAAGSTDALAAKCNVVGFWTATITGTTTAVASFQMSTNKRGTSPYPNPECNNETSKITTTLLTKTQWQTHITAKKCSVVIATATTWDPGSCTQATGYLDIPGMDSIPITVNAVGGGKRLPSRTLMTGLK